ncbi:unnamed protein product, partial [Prorocentrum cordatum]
AKCYHCSAPNPGHPGFSGGPGPGRRGTPRGAWAWGPGKAAAPPWRDGPSQPRGPGGGRQPAAPPAAAVLDDQQLERWVAMEDEKFAQLASVLGQSLRDRIVHRRRLRAAGMEDPRGKDLPQPVVKAQRVALQATQRLERARQAAQEAAEELEAAEAQLVAARGDLEQAKQDAADTAAGDQAGPPVSASTWDDFGKLAGLVNQLAATCEDQLAQLAAGNKPSDTGHAVAQQNKEALQKLTAALPAAPPAQASPPRPLMEGSLGACQLTSPWERHQLEVVPTPRSGSATKQRLQDGYGVMSGTGPARTKARMFFGNSTQHGPTARKFLEEHGSGFDVVGFCETHTSPAAAEQQQLDLQKGNWNVAVTPGTPSGRPLDGVAGGEMLAIKKTLAATTFEGLRRACQAAGRPPPFFGFVPMVWHLLQGNVLVVVAYLVPGLRFRGANQQRLAPLAAFLSLAKDPFVIAGDWNVEPTDWGETEWLQRLGQGQVYGYVLASSGYAEHVKVVAEPNVPWRTHCGLVIELTSSNRRWYHQAPALPSAPPLRCPPKVAADPSSRRRRKLAAQASKRREALPEELRDSHDTLLAGADEPGGPAGEDDLGHAPFPLPDYTAPWTGRWRSAGGGTWSSDQCCGDALSAATAPAAVRRTSMDDDVDPMGVLADEDDAGFAGPPEHDPVPSSSPMTEVKSALPLATEARGRDDGAPADIEYLVSSETWPRCAAAMQAWKPSSQRPADQDHFLFARVPLPTDHVSQMHAQWVGNLEEALIQTEQGWQTLSTLLVRLVALLTNGSDPPQQRERVARATPLLRAREGENDHHVYFGQSLQEDAQDCRLRAGIFLQQEMPNLDDAQRLLACTEQRCRRLHGRSLHRARLGHIRWANEARQRGPGIVHRHVREPAAEQLETYGLARDADGDVAARSIAQPDAILEQKTLHWERVWKDPTYDEADLVEALNDTLRRAADDGLDPITPDQVRTAMRRMSSGKARGIDNLSPADLQRMPEDGFDGLAALLNVREASGVWPWQLSAVIGAAIPKRGGGDRIIGTLPTTCKVWAKVRAAATDEWSDAQALWWDTAARESPAPRAAVCRACMGECDVENGWFTATLLLDIKKFYDSVSFVHLLAVATQQGFPAIVAAMEVQLYAGPRHLRQRAWLGRRLQPERSVAAVSGNGGKLTKVMLGPVIARAHRACERAQLWTFIDDAVIRSVGARQSVKADIYQAAVALKQGLDEAGFEVSTKTVLARSHPQPGRTIAGGLVRLGVPASCAAHAVDLGVDTTCGRRRCRKRAQKRFQAAKGRLGRILRMRREVRMAKITKMLWATGAQPQATYGRQVAGLAPSPPLALRRGAAASAVGKGPGRCLTSTLAALYGQRDPGLELRRQVVSQWFELWRTWPEVHGRARRAWPRLLKALSQAGPHRWRRVRGPAAAVIAVILDTGWRPESPRRWARLTGPNAVDEWIIPGPDAECFAVADASGLLDDFMADFARHVAAGALDQRAQTVVIVSGGQRARERQQQAGYDSEVTCQRCGTEKETLFHRIRSCPCNTGHADFDASECLTVRARVGWEQDPALWLRGVCPSDLTTPVFDECQADWVEHQGEPFDNCRIEGEEVLDVFGDGSGGPHAADPR